jgi:preprotein translocase subunit SecD
LDGQDQVGFGQLTQRVTTQPQPKNQLAIVFDGKVLSAPTIEQAITGGQFQITGGATAFTKDQAQALAADLSG